MTGKISDFVELLGAGVDQANDLVEIVDMSEAGDARNKKIKISELLGLVTDIVGLLDFKGSTDCSANPNYPAASKGDFYVVSVAGKIGGASGVTVEVGDAYFALADNAGGTQAGVGTSWTVIQGNIVGSSITELDDIPDVNAPTPANGDVLTWDSTPGEWVPAAPTGGSNALDDLTDVDAPTPSDGDVLTYDSGSGDWVPSAPTGGGGAMELISEVITSSSQSTVTFASIATTWRDLILVVRGRGTNATTTVNVLIRFNNDTGNNYHHQDAHWSNATAGTVQGVSQASGWVGIIPAASATANYAGSCQSEIMAYDSTTFFKSVLSRTGWSLGTGATTQGSGHFHVEWISTAAINEIDVFLSAGNFADGSIVSLYGRM